MIYQCDRCGDKKKPCQIDIPYMGDPMEDKTLCILNGYINFGDFNEVKA